MLKILFYCCIFIQHLCFAHNLIAKPKNNCFTSIESPNFSLACVSTVTKFVYKKRTSSPRILVNSLLKFGRE